MAKVFIFRVQLPKEPSFTEEVRAANLYEAQMRLKNHYPSASAIAYTGERDE